MSTLIDLNSDNINKCVSMYCSVFNEKPWNDGWTEDAAHERLITFTRIPRFEGLALTVDGDPMAMVLGWGERWAKGWVFLIKEICVHKNSRRRGMGTQLMSEFESRLTKANYISAYLETLSEGPSADFYAALGFDQIPLVMLRKRFG